MTAVLRSLKFLEFKVSILERIPYSYFKEVSAQHWQLKHYLSFRLRNDETILPWSKIYNEWRQSLEFISKNLNKTIPGCVSSFCAELLKICDTFEGDIVLRSCEKFYEEFYQRSIDLQIAERRRLLETTIFSEQKYTEFLQASGQKRIVEDIEDAASSNEKRVCHNVVPEFSRNCDIEENKNNEESGLFNNQGGGVEYDTEVRNLLNESETCSQELSTILAAFRTYQHEAKNILSENGIMDLRPSSEFVLLYLKETEYDLLIEKVFEPIDKIFPKEADDFLIDFFSEKLSEQQWENKIESLMEDNSGQNKFIIKLKRLIIETLPIFFDSYKLMSDNPLKNKEMTEEEYMNTYINPILKNALIRFSDIRYVPGGKAIKASTYRKTVMNQKGSADRADGIAYTSNQQNSYEISVTEGSRPYVTEKNKEIYDFIQNARAAKDLINFVVTQEVLHKRPLPAYFRTFMVQVFEFNLRFYFMEYLAQYCIFEIETCEVPTDWKETLQFSSFYRAIVTWALLVGEADKKFQESRNKKSSRLSNSHNIRKLLRLSHNDDRGDKLRQELFNTSLELSSQDHSISKNIKPEQIEISETTRPEKLENVDGSVKCIVNSFNINEVSQHLAQLCETAIGAEDRASKANQEEIICWSLYGRDFEFQVGEMSSKNKIGEKKARTLIYNEIENQLSILQSRISISPSLENTPEDNIIEISGTARLEKISPHIKVNDSVSSCQITTKTKRFNEFPRLELYFSINAEGEHQIDSYYIFGSQICPICEKKHWYLNGKWWTNEGNKFYYLVCDNSNEPGVPFEEIIKVLPKEYTSLYPQHSSVSCPICNKKENIRDNIEGKWGCGDYVNTKTYRLKCWEAYQNEIQIVTVKA
ncbi:40613_t:CDS:10 [Gigaspora margarita]|uniref:40613_t:CDS:1 n=1 Tax=Gigaspora margarita TaxID=4874 RepID=A0ABN7UX25_GIGMA|nr:40613_t:CDS:10 [Gigaspora margarita]